MKHYNTLQSCSLPHIGFIGGDMRQVYAYQDLKNKNYPLSAYGLANGVTSDNLPDVLKETSVLVCGIPFSKDSKTLFLTSAPFQKNTPISIDYFLSCLFHRKDAAQLKFLFAGKIPKKVKHYCLDNQIYCHDFLEDEYFAAANALPTAEGAIMEAIALGNTVLENHNCLVLGYGKCGCVLAKKLKSLSANVTIYTRHPEQKAYFEAQGFHFYDGHLPYTANKSLNQDTKKIVNNITNNDTDKTILEAANINSSSVSPLKKYHYIFNTVPALLLDSYTLSQLSPHTVIIDIASLPGGIDYEAIKSFPLHVKHTLGIPGKIAPKYAGELISQTILSSIHENGL